MKKLTNKLGKTLLMLCLNSISVIGLSQDTIYKTDGKIIIGKISEIGGDNISYHRFDFQDGPMYVEKKSNVKSISFSTGMKQVFEKQTEDYFDEKQKPIIDLNVKKSAPILSSKIESFGSPYRFHFQNALMTEREMHHLVLSKNNSDLSEEIKKAKRFKGLQYVGFAAIPLGITSISLMADGGNTGNDVNIFMGIFCGAATIACPIVSGICKANRGKSNLKAVALYNQKY